MPPTPAETENHTITGLLLRNARDYPDHPALSWQAARVAPDSEWTTLTWSQVRERVLVLARGYASVGVEPGDHVLLMMGNRPEHWLSDLATVHAGAIPSTVYGTAAFEQVDHIARHSRARVAVVGDAATAAAWEPLLNDPTVPMERLVVVDEPDTTRGHTAYSDLTEATPEGVADRWHDVAPDDPLTVVYTSGTTGDPKGVVVSHHNVLANAVALDAVVELPEHAAHVCYLPLAHIAERMLGLYLPIFRASHVWMCADPLALATVLARVRPPQLFGVPRIWEKLASAVRAGLAQLPEEQSAVVEQARAVADEHVAHRERGEEVPAELEERYQQVRTHVLGPILARAGLDRVEWAACASAPMSLDVIRFWAGFGVVIMDAWGLTESVGVATANSPTSGFRLGSVGRAVESVQVRVAEDGEVFVRGDSVFSGYLSSHGDVRSATDEDGWFATGDVGRLDEDGYLWITDRKKELIITSSGKNVSPTLVENTLKEHPLIGQSFAHGDGRPYLVALLVLDEETAPAWAAARGIDPGGNPLVEHPEVRAEVERAVGEANARLSRPEQVKRYRLLTEEWGPDTGELTPSLKLRRRVVREKYLKELEALYQD